MAEAETKTQAPAKIAAVLVRSRVGVRGQIQQALDTLNLRKRNTCAVMEDKPALRGQLRKCQDFIAYGTISKETEQKLTAKIHDGKISVYRLGSPAGGYGGSNKRNVKRGGSLGHRKDMDSFVQRMVW